MIWNPAFTQRIQLAEAGFQIAHFATLRFAFGMTVLLCFSCQKLTILQARHPRERGNPDFPQFRWLKVWFPAFAGMTMSLGSEHSRPPGSG